MWLKAKTKVELKLKPEIEMKVVQNLSQLGYMKEYLVKQSLSMKTTIKC